MPLIILLMLPLAELVISPPFSMNGRRGQMGRDLPKPSQLTAKPGSNHGGVAFAYGVWCTPTHLWLAGFKRDQKHSHTPTAPLPPSHTAPSLCCLCHLQHKIQESSGWHRKQDGYDDVWRHLREVSQKSSPPYQVTPSCSEPAHIQLLVPPGENKNTATI